MASVSNSLTELEEKILRWAEELGVEYEARKKWRQRRVPHEWRLPLAEKAEKEGITLRARDFDRLFQ
jgi:hypothetical protein